MTKAMALFSPMIRPKSRVLHIKDFAHPGPRPIVGCALDYLVILDEQGRYRAQQVMYLKASQTKTAKTKTKTSGRSQQEKLQPMQVASVAYILVLAGLSLAGLLSGMILLLVSLMNVLSYWLYAQDKEAAQLGNRRIPENTLHLVAFRRVAGSLAGTAKLRHKTQNNPSGKFIFVL